MSNLTYRTCGTTCRLVLLGFFVGTFIFVLTDKLTGDQWVTGVLGMLAGYVLRDGVAKIAEAYRDKGKDDAPAG